MELGMDGGLGFVVGGGGVGLRELVLLLFGWGRVWLGWGKLWVRGVGIMGGVWLGWREWMGGRMDGSVVRIGKRYGGGGNVGGREYEWDDDVEGGGIGGGGGGGGGWGCGWGGGGGRGGWVGGWGGVEGGGWVGGLVFMV
uniref:Uncharacterized protein n=1 Tax=Knipowitschia caucasica TaxID=637954 RepID=A0AAV2KVM5_KNICA